MRILGWIAMVLGIIGIVASLAFAAGVWFVKPSIQAPIDDLVAAADAGLARALALTDTVASGLGDAEARVGDVKTKADAVAAAPVDSAVVTALATAVNSFISGPYANLRSGYAALRERVTTVGEALQALDRAIAAVSLPGVAMERLQSIDARLTEIDASVTSLAQDGAAGFSRPGVAAGVSERAASAQAKLTAIGQQVKDIGATMQDTRGRLSDAGDKVALLLTVGAGGSTILGLYLAGLNLLLFQQGRRWSRRKPAPPEQVPSESTV